MLLGIDFGTTRTIVAGVDRGNYPVLGFVDSDGDAQDYFPCVVADLGAELAYGFDAVAAAQAGAPFVRSFKRLLGEPTTNPGTPITVGDRTLPLLDVISGFLGALHSALPPGADRAVVSVPAHAHRGQRFMTLEAFRRAGFDVIAMVNEPSAAGFEFTHRQPRSVTSRRTQVLVYDLGGGTFDASLIQADGSSHAVLGSVGVNRLGGDDFDAVLAEVALAATGRTADDLSPASYAELVEECRDAKERLSPQSRRIALEVDGDPVVLAVDDFYTAAAGLIEQTLVAIEPLLGSAEDPAPASSVAGIYLVGGASGLPLVPRVLRERFGRRVHRSPYPAASTAIGAAIAADPESGFTLSDRLSRRFGVFREGDRGQRLHLDPIFGPDDLLPNSAVTSVTRRYVAAHNVGWFRYVEYATIDQSGEPRGDLVPYAEVVFPFDPALRGRRDIEAVPVRRCDNGPLIEETYTIDANGIVAVRISDLTTGYSQEYGLTR